MIARTTSLQGQRRGWKIIACQCDKLQTSYRLDFIFSTAYSPTPSSREKGRFELFICFSLLPASIYVQPCGKSAKTGVLNRQVSPRDVFYEISLKKKEARVSPPPPSHHYHPALLETQAGMRREESCGQFVQRTGRLAKCKQPLYWPAAVLFTRVLTCRK